MTLTASLRIGPQGRVVLPVAVRRAAGLDEGSELVATVDGAGRVVLETAESVQARVWAGAPPAGDDATSDVRSARNADIAWSEDAAQRRRGSTAGQDAGAVLLDRLGL